MGAETYDVYFRAQRAEIARTDRRARGAGFTLGPCLRERPLFMSLSAQDDGNSKSKPVAIPSEKD